MQALQPQPRSYARALPACARAAVDLLASRWDGPLALLLSGRDGQLSLFEARNGATEATLPGLGAAGGDPLVAEAIAAARAGSAGGRDLVRSASRDGRLVVALPLVGHKHTVEGCVLAVSASPVAPARLEEIGVLGQFVGATLAQARAYDQTLRSVRRLNRVREATLSMGEAEGLLAVLERGVELARSLAFAEASALGVHGGARAGLDFWVYRRAADLPEGGPQVPQAVVHAVRSEGRTVRLHDLSQDPRFRDGSGADSNVRSLLATPLKARGQTVGTLLLLNRRGADAFSDDDQRVVELFAQHAAFLVLHEQVREQQSAEQKLRAARETELRTSEATLRSALRNSPVATAALGIDGRFLLANAAFCRMVDREEGELHMLTYDDLFPEPVNEQEREAFRSVLSGARASCQVRRTVRTRRGDPRVLNVSVSRTNSGERAGGLVLQLEDMSERLATAEALRRSEGQFQALFESALDAMLVFDDQRRCVEANSAALELLGVGAGELDRVGKLALRDAADQKLGEALFAKGDRKGELALLDGNRRARRVEFSARLNFVPGRHLAVLRDSSGRYEAEQAVRRNERNLSRAQSIAHFGHWMWRLDSGEVEWSDECFRILGRRVDEVAPSYETFLAHVHPDDAARWQERIQESARTGNRFEIEHRLLRPDGSERTVHCVGDVEPDEAGRPLLLVGTMHDITDQIQVREALRRSEERFRLLADRSEDVIFLYRLGDHAGLDYVCRAAQSLTGYSTEELYRDGTLMLSIVHPEDRRLLDAVMQNPESFNGPVTLRFIRKDRMIVWTEARFVGLRDRMGNLTGVQCVARDISDRKRAEREREALLEQLSADRTWLRAVIEHSPAGILMYERVDGQVRVMGNRRAEALLGRHVSPENGPAQFVGSLYRMDGAPIREEELPSVRALNGEVSIGEEVLVRTPAGEDVPIMVNAGPITDDSGTVHGAVVMFSDLRRIKELERLREEWNSLIAHDLRQPLNIISGYGNLLRRLAERRGVKELVSPAEQILSSVRQMNRMVEDLMDASLVESRRLTLHWQEVEPEPLVHGIVERFRQAYEDRKVELVAEEPLAAVTCDPDRLEQVLANLLSNAVKYGDREAPVVVRLAPSEGGVHFTVSNHGAGIPEKELPGLFSRFKRTAAARDGSAQGLGLGLYITKGLVEALGGRIWAESTPGETTSFHFVLPVRTLEAPHPGDSGEHEPSHVEGQHEPAPAP